MKKQYIMAMLLMMAFGVVSTMAFTVDSTVTGTIGLFDVTPDPTHVTVTSATWTALGKRQLTIRLGLTAASIANSDAIVKVTIMNDAVTPIVWVPPATSPIEYGIDAPGTTTLDSGAPNGSLDLFTFDVADVLTNGNTYIELIIVDSNIDIVDDGQSGGAIGSVYVVITDAVLDSLTDGCDLT